MNYFIHFLKINNKIEIKAYVFTANYKLLKEIIY